MNSRIFSLYIISLICLYILQSIHIYCIPTMLYGSLPIPWIIELSFTSDVLLCIQQQKIFPQYLKIFIKTCYLKNSLQVWNQANLYTKNYVTHKVLPSLWLRNMKLTWLKKGFRKINHNWYHFIWNLEKLIKWILFNLWSLN